MYIPYLSGRKTLLPCNLGEMIPAMAPVRIIDAVLNTFDLSQFHAQHSSNGRPSYDPEMMLKLLIFAYTCNVCSSRAIERFAERDIHALWLVGGNAPESSTINRFRKNSGPLIDAVFTALVLELGKRDLVSFEEVFIDGTTIQGRSKPSKIVWRKSVTSREKVNKEKIRNLLKQFHEGESIDDERIDELPLDASSLATLCDDIEKSIAANAATMPPSVLRKKRKICKELKERTVKQAGYEADLRVMGDRNSFVRTDPDATGMILKEDRSYVSHTPSESSNEPEQTSPSPSSNDRPKASRRSTPPLETKATATPQKQTKKKKSNGRSMAKPGFNLEIITKNQVVLAFEIFQTTSDTVTLESVLNSFEARYGHTPARVIADAAYGTEANYEMLEKKNIIPYVKYQSYDHEQTKEYRENIFHPDHLKYDAEGDYYTCPNHRKLCFVRSSPKDKTGSENRIYQCENCTDCALRSACYKGRENRLITINRRTRDYEEKARNNLLSDKGQRLLAQRAIEPETVFGQFKANLGMRRTNFFGIEMLKVDLNCRFIAHNFRKMTEIKPKPRNRKSKAKKKAQK